MWKRGACSPLFLLSGVGIVKELGGEMGVNREGGEIVLPMRNKRDRG